MRTVDEDEIETIHLYVVREDDRKPPSPLPVMLSLMCLLGIVALTVYSGNHPYYEHKTIRVPAIFLPLHTFTATIPIIPTGIKTYPTTQARGVLTLYNGSILTQYVPRGMILSTQNGIEIVIDAPVIVPAGNPPYYGIASVSAHAVVAGAEGNIASYAINEVYGTSLYIRNLQAFKGGKNSYSVKVETALDRQTALDSARPILTTQEAEMKEFLAYPCKEAAQEKNGRLGLSWACQFVTYAVPSYMHVTAVHLVGKILFVDIVFVPRPRIIQCK